MRTGTLVDACYPYRAYNELVFLFASVINEIQNGPVSGPHRSIARMLAPDDAVITFNWDTLMDRALTAETSWRVDWGYGVPPRGVFDDGWRAAHAAPACRKHPRLIKLHGSTNWLTAYTVPGEAGQMVLSHQLDPGTLHVFEQATKPYACYAGRYMGGYEAFVYGYYPPNLQDVPGRPASPGRVIVRARLKSPWKDEGGTSDEGLVAMPLLIPPVRFKTYRMFGELFSGLWKEAEDTLAAAGEIVVIGYSFPKTDLQSHALFANAFTRRDLMPQVTVLDPQPDRIVDKFRLELGISTEKLNVRKDYFSEELDLQTMLDS